MKRTRFLLALLMLIGLVLSFQAGAQMPPQSDIRRSLIVSTEQLSQHLKDDSLVLLHVGEKDEYKAAHIPGAQFIQLADISTPRGQGLEGLGELPAVAQLQTTFEKLGVRDKSRIVVYFGKDWVTPTARVFLTLDYLGLGDHTSILDGGLPAWHAEGRPVTTEVRTPAPGKFTPRLNTKIVVDALWVNANLNKPGVMILDARASKFYTGEEVGRMPRGGHIPGARNIPFDSVVEEPAKRYAVEAARRVKARGGVIHFFAVGQVFEQIQKCRDFAPTLQHGWCEEG